MRVQMTGGWTHTCDEHAFVSRVTELNIQDALNEHPVLDHIVYVMERLQEYNMSHDFISLRRDCKITSHNMIWFDFSSSWRLPEFITQRDFSSPWWDCKKTLHMTLLLCGHSKNMLYTMTICHHGHDKNTLHNMTSFHHWVTAITDHTTGHGETAELKL